MLPKGNSDDVPPSCPAIVIDFDNDTFMRLDGRTVRVHKLEFTPAYCDLRSSISVDFSSGARDTLIDVLSDRKWIIPDPKKAISATRQGYDVALTYQRKTAASLDALSLPPHVAATKGRWSAQVTNAIQTQILLRCLDEQTDALSQDGPDADISVKLDRATQLLTAGQYEDAKALYWETCAVVTSLVALVNLTYIYEREKDLDQALRLAWRTIELFPLQEDGFKNAATICMEMGNFDQAHEVLDAARDLHAGKPELLRKEAELLRLEGRWSQAAATFSHLCAINRSDAKARLNLAVCESKQGLDEEAAWDAMEAFRLGLDAPALAWHVVTLLKRVGRFAEAMDVGIQAITKAQPNAPAASIEDLRLQTAIAAYEAGQRDVAEELIKPVQGDAPLLAYLRGLLCFARGEPRAAYEFFRRYVDAHADDRRGLHNLSVAAMEAGLYAEAHAALLMKAFSEEDTRDFWTMRAMAAAYAGDHEDAERAAERAADHGVDAAALLMACSDAALQVQQHIAWPKLRMAAVRFTSNDGQTIFQQAMVQTDLLAQGQIAADDIEAHLDRAERCGAIESDIVFGRMLLALRSGRDETISALSQRVLDASITATHALILAAEAEGLRRSELALRLLERHRPEHIVSLGPLSLPHPDALRAAALLRLGRPPEQVRPLVERLATLDEHPLYHIVTAYWCYAQGDLERTLALLDRVGEMTKRGELVELPLRLQCLIEMCRYTAAAVLLRAYLPGLPVTACAPWWSRNGDLDVVKVQALLDASSILPSAVRMASQMQKGTEHVLLTIKNGALSPMVVACPRWESAFVFARDMGSDHTPIVIRATPAPLATIQRLCGHPIG